VTAGDSQIEEFLSALRARRRSSPAGYAWQQFYELLRARKQPGSTNPPVPLILAASGASNAAKHQRLTLQLRWARENGCLDEAIEYLQGIPSGQWNSGLWNGGTERATGWLEMQESALLPAKAFLYVCLA
jgi:hypothetical protein